MKKLILSAALTMMAGFGLAQAPQLINYQGIARNTGGTELVNQSVGLQLTIHSTNTTGPVVYRETQNPTTNQFGLFNIRVGNGTVVQGTFSAIAWGSDIYFIEVEMDETGGTNYQQMGVSQLVSVPYAMYADTAAYADIPQVNKFARPSGAIVVTGDLTPVFFGDTTITLGSPGTIYVDANVSFQPPSAASGWMGLNVRAEQGLTVIENTTPAAYSYNEVQAGDYSTMSYSTILTLPAAGTWTLRIRAHKSGNGIDMNVHTYNLSAFFLSR